MPKSDRGDQVDRPHRSQAVAYWRAPQGLTCAAAYKSLTKGGNAGYKCHTIGQTKKLPVLVKCVATKSKHRFYIYKAYGG